MGSVFVFNSTRFKTALTIGHPSLSVQTAWIPPAHSVTAVPPYRPQSISVPRAPVGPPPDAATFFDGADNATTVLMLDVPSNAREPPYGPLSLPIPTASDALDTTDLWLYVFASSVVLLNSGGAPIAWTDDQAQTYTPDERP